MWGLLSACQKSYATVKKDDFKMSLMGHGKNHRKSDVPENSIVVCDFLQKELHEGNAMLVKVN